jgi:F-type H+-transporting ATPase subunit b
MTPTAWVGIAFFLFIALLWKIGVFKILGSTLDKRAAQIEEELNEARKLKEEAQALLASFQRKQRKAEEAADEIISHAKSEAKLLLKEAKKRISSEVEKRTEIAEQKIKQAETAVIQQIRDNAVDITVNAARALIVDNLGKAESEELMENAVDELSRKFH